MHCGLDAGRKEGRKIASTDSSIPFSLFFGRKPPSPSSDASSEAIATTVVTPKWRVECVAKAESEQKYNLKQRSKVSDFLELRVCK